MKVTYYVANRKQKGWLSHAAITFIEGDSVCQAEAELCIKYLDKRPYEYIHTEALTRQKNYLGKTDDFREYVVTGREHKQLYERAFVHGCRKHFATLQEAVQFYKEYDLYNEVTVLESWWGIE